MAPKKRTRANDDQKKQTKRQKAEAEAEETSPAVVTDGEAKSTVNSLFVAPVKKQQNDAQKARTPHLAIPVDENCPLDGKFRVYIDEDEIIHDVSLNQSNAVNNNNKFYRIQLLECKLGGEYYTWTRWGRVGEAGANGMLGDGSLESAMYMFEKKFKDKSGHPWSKRLDPPKKGKYVFIERSYEPDSSEDESEKKLGDGSRRGSIQSGKAEPPSELPLPVQNLMELIFNQQYFKEVMADLEYDAERLPLGKLSKRTMEQGYQALKDLAALVLNPDPSSPQMREQMEEFSNLFYSYIPHAFGRNRPPVISTESMLKREIQLLESLSDMRVAEEIMKDAKQDNRGMNALDKQFAGLNMSEMAPLDPKSKEFKELDKYLHKTKGDTHSLTYKIEDIFRIERDGEFARFDASEFAKLDNSDRRLLWHGSRATNFGGILSQGLRIAPPEAPASGYMFGKGVYLADMSSKSANYCVPSFSGNVGLLLLCEAELGNPMLELTAADYNAGTRAQEAGACSTWGKGLTAPLKWKDAACVHKTLKGVTMPDVTVKPGDSKVKGAYLMYNEYIAYDVSQIRLRYLFRVKMDGYGY